MKKAVNMDWYRLAKAVCRQWIYDGKPKSGLPGIKKYARIIQQYRQQCSLDEWYKQGVLHAHD